MPKQARIELPALTLRIYRPASVPPHDLMPTQPRWLLRWEVYDTENEIVAANAWHLLERSPKVAALHTLLNALDLLATFRLACPKLDVQFPQIDPKTHDTAFTMLRRRSRPTPNRSFNTYLAV